MSLEAHVIQLVVEPGQTIDFQRDFVADFVVLGREAVGEFPADHQLDDLVHVHLAGRVGGDPLTVPHDGDFIGDPQDFVHFVGDVDDGHAPVPEHVDDAEQVFHFLFGQGRGRFVEYDDLGVEGDRLGDFHHLSGSHRHGAHDLLRVHIDFQFPEDRLGVLQHFLFIHDAKLRGVAATRCCP